VNIVPDDAKIAELTIAKLRQLTYRLAVTQIRADLGENVGYEHNMPSGANCLDHGGFSIVCDETDMGLRRPNEQSALGRGVML
jgi:hypothetical protein